MVASVLALTMAGLEHGAWAAATEQDVKTALAEFERTNPKIKAFLESAHGYAVFPTVAKGAIGIGGAHGDGLVYEKGKLIGATTLSQITIGFQLGGQAYRELICWMEAKYGYDKWDAYMMLSQCGKVRLGNFVDPKYTIGAAVPKKYL